MNTNLSPIILPKSCIILIWLVNRGLKYGAPHVLDGPR